MHVIICNKIAQFYIIHKYIIYIYVHIFTCAECSSPIVNYDVLIVWNVQLYYVCVYHFSNIIGTIHIAHESCMLWNIHFMYIFTYFLFALYQLISIVHVIYKIELQYIHAIIHYYSCKITSMWIVHYLCIWSNVYEYIIYFYISYIYIYIIYI